MAERKIDRDRMSKARLRHWEGMDLEERRRVMKNANIGTTVSATVKRIRKAERQLAQDRARLEALRMEYPEVVAYHEGRADS